MQRRTFLKMAAASAGSTVAISNSELGMLGTARAAVGANCGGSSSGISDLEFESGASLLDSNYGALTDSSVVAVWAESTASNGDADSNGDAYYYSDSTDIPVVAVDGNVVGFGAMLVNDGDANWEYGNEEFVLNVWDQKLGGSGTVLWDEGHGQYYTLSSFSSFESYAEDNGYTVTATSSLTSDLSSADAAVITSPGDFTESELQALSDFVNNGGVLFLHDQSDYSNHDTTGNLNDIAGYLQRSFRFNDDEVTDSSNNSGSDYAILTSNFNESTFNFFDTRSGLGGGSGGSFPKTGTVSSVTDGDTVDVDFDDGTSESVRVLGLDTPETRRNKDYERVQEWEGIEDLKYLTDWGANASDFAKQELDGVTVTVEIDEEEGAYDVYDRLLGYVYYDADGDGNRDDLYNLKAIEQGYSRVYGSGLTKHESFWDAEQTARANGIGVWGQSDPNNSSEIRDRDVGDVFFPHTTSIRTSSGALADSRAPVYAESTATQNGGSVSYSQIPLAGVDESANVGAIGSPLIDESYESDEGFAVDTSGYENFVFVTNLVDYLSDTGSGDVLIDGGHGQFNASFALSNEDAAYYQRYLEGQDIGFEQVNAITSDNLSGARALVVTAPTECYTSSEVSAINDFLSNGGAVVMLGSSKATDDAHATLNDLANALGTDLRFNDDEVTDSTNNVNGDQTIPYTTTFDTSFPLFSKYS